MVSNPRTRTRQRDPHHAAEEIVRLLQGEGHVAYFAGGCVRDRIMGREPSDYDVASDATPERVLELFRVAKRVGEAFGVVMVRVKGCWVEVATFRAESGYADGRRPDRVEYTDAEHDAARRDFTINGLFEDPVDGRVIDYVGGRRDIEGRVIRAIGEPDERFAEDYLRMLRAVRFAARLGFELEPATAAAIRAHAPKLGRISRERIGMEARMMLEHPERAEAARLMQGLGLDAPALGEEGCGREPATLAALPVECDYPTALAAWAIDRRLEPGDFESRETLRRAIDRIKPVQIARRWRKALTLANEHRDGLRDLLSHVPQALDWAELDVARQKRLLARRDRPRLHALLLALAGRIHDESFDVMEFERRAADLLAEGVAPEPLITGDDLIAEGMRPGPAFKRLLDQVYDAQLAGAVTTGRGAISLARTLAREEGR